MPGNLIKINPRDNVAVTLTPLVKGDVVNIKGDVITILTEVPAGHKVATQDIPKGGRVIKYGQPVGIATEDIARGQALHIFNMKGESLHDDAPYIFDRTKSEQAVEALMMRKEEYRENNLPRISAYVRESGEIGIRNQIWLLALSPEAKEKAEELKDWAKGRLGIEDGVKVWARIEGGNNETAEKVLVNVAAHPNAGGVIVLAETEAELEKFRSLMWQEEDGHMVLLTTENEDRIRDTMAVLAERIKGEKRQSVPVSALRLGLKCTGSDSFSGITANPLVGMIVDELVAMGGTGLLTETPEMFGAERLLLERAESEEVFHDVVSMLAAYKDHVRSAGREPYETLSIENRRGGLTTLTERSIGCIQKGGISPVAAALTFNERIEKNGLNLMPGPGTDEVSLQLQAAAGCHMILYTTGDGNIPSVALPLVAISTRQSVLERNRGRIDFNAGRLLREDDAEVTESLMTDIIAVACGQKTTLNEADE